MSCVFGFDYGSRLLGVAVGNQLTHSARALATVNMHHGQPDWIHLDKLRQAWLPDLLVIGLPITLDGSEQTASRKARLLADCLHERYNLPVYLIDERYSSQEAAQRFATARAVGLKKRHDAASIDAEAAAVILERWLAQHANDQHHAL